VLSPKDDKMIIGVPKINFIGLQISFGKIILQPHILEYIHSFLDEIKDKTQLQRFIGCINYVAPFYL
jgi:hypothetical protein